MNFIKKIAIFALFSAITQPNEVNYQSNIDQLYLDKLASKVLISSKLMKLQAARAIITINLQSRNFSEVEKYKEKELKLIQELNDLYEKLSPEQKKEIKFNEPFPLKPTEIKSKNNQGILAYLASFFQRS